jgi:TatD DNase family protein
MPVFYDTHAHLDYPDYAEDLPAALERALAAGVAKIICVGTDLASSERAVKLAERFPNLFAAVGWHPTHANEAPEDLRPALRALAQHPKVVAIGETGLDYYRLPNRSADGSARDIDGYKRNQRRIFEQQLEVAADSGLNVVVHQRASLDDALAMMARFAGRVRGQFHCFADDVAAMRRILELGSIVSFTGILTYKNTQAVREALAATPMGRFMLETDSPYLVPEPHRGNKVKRCEPAFVRDIAVLAAQVKGCTLEELSATTCATAQEFFPKLR